MWKLNKFRNVEVALCRTKWLIIIFWEGVKAHPPQLIHHVQWKFNIKLKCRSGGIGRRARFRFVWLTPWGFESLLRHFLSLIIMSVLYSHSLGYRCSFTGFSYIIMDRDFLVHLFLFFYRPQNHCVYKIFWHLDFVH